MKNLIEEVQAIIDEEYSKASTRLAEAGMRAPESYTDDLNGYTRGVSVIGAKIIEHLKEALKAPE